MNVAICICTYKRPAMLRRLLSSLPPDTTTIVVDNDPERSVEIICREFGVVYSCEPRRGISHARNTALGLADADLIACIDDDEYPSSAWLSELLRCQSQYDADIVIGPVLPDFAPAAPEWAKRGGFYARPRCNTGDTPPHLCAGNMLIRKRILWPEPFNPDFALTGAEDTDFFMRVRQREARIIYCNEAIAYEHIPAERCTPRYIRRRAFSGGSSYTHIALSHGASRLSRCIKGLARVAIGAAILPVAAMRDKSELVRAQQSIYLGLGTISALAGRRHYFYR